LIDVPKQSLEIGICLVFDWFIDLAGFKPEVQQKLLNGSFFFNLQN